MYFDKLARHYQYREDILIFLTGQEEIESAVKSIRDIARNMTGNVPNMLVCPLYAALPSQQQLKVFQPTPKVSLILPSYS
jgi:pre-mRNA-splicing factor ATP-dependent RNA helicase DHX16